MKGDDLADRLVEFAVQVIAIVDSLPKSSAGKHIGGQLLRSGTSPGANYEEARAAESKADFVHKLSIVHKECCKRASGSRLFLEQGCYPRKRCRKPSVRCRSCVGLSANLCPLRGLENRSPLPGLIFLV